MLQSVAGFLVAPLLEAVAGAVAETPTVFALGLGLGLCFPTGSWRRLSFVGELACIATVAAPLEEITAGGALPLDMVLVMSLDLPMLNRAVWRRRSSAMYTLDSSPPWRL